MKAADLIDHVANAASIEKSVAKRTLDAVLEGIVEARKRGEEVNLSALEIQVKDSPARQGRIPAPAR
jgi:nucleoid DNA-binding protein